ncbi:YlbL family protein [Yinghuangia sp. YIM S10712]|uniref:YlbL family protein n=1 Tax=Yinghuangia sp. YIM S10712 TaxID=3436930 RepID=UPI003F52F234
MARSKRNLAVSLLLVVILGVFAFAVPLPYTTVTPGETADALGTDGAGVPVIRIEGATPQPTDGKLLVVTIRATNPDQDLYLTDLFDAWWDPDEAAVPKSSVYPEGKSTQEITEQNTQAMVESQDNAAVAALRHLGLDPNQVKVQLNLANVGGPSAGLMFSLGIVDQLGDVNLTGGEIIAGTGTIDADGKVGPVGGVEMKTKAAKRDGATVFLLPEHECGNAEKAAPDGLRLVPVDTLTEAIGALTALQNGGKVPSC